MRFVFANLPPKSLSLGNLHFIIKILLIEFVPNNQNQCQYYAKGTIITHSRDPQTCAHRLESKVFATFILVNVAQSNYVSRNKLHCIGNLNFGLMCKKEKHCWALSRILFISVQLIVFLDHVLLPAELAQKFKLLYFLI